MELTRNDAYIYSSLLLISGLMAGLDGFMSP